MSMEKVFRLEFLHELQKAFKSLVAEVLSIPHPTRRRMRYEDINSTAIAPLVIEQTRHQLPNPPLHLFLRVLAVPIVIQHRSTEAHDDEIMLLVIYAFPINKATAEVRHRDNTTRPGIAIKSISASSHHAPEILQIMVAIYIPDILSEHRLDIVIVPKRKITGRDDKVNIPVKLRGNGGIDQSIGSI